MWTKKSDQAEKASQDQPNWLLRNVLPLGAGVQPTTKLPVSDMAAVNQPQRVDRYQHDIKQATLMRQAMSKRQLGIGGVGKERPITEDDVLAGLKGLDRAEQLRDQGQLQESFRICKAAIGILIGFLRSDPTILPNIDRSSIGKRVDVALTQAEQLKQAIGDRQSDAASNPASPSSVTVTSRVSPTRSDHKDVPLFMQPEKRMEQISTRRPSNPAITYSASEIPDDNDPLVKTVKSDLYVDPSSLQDVHWDDIAGLESAKQSLQENAILPMIRPDLFTGLRKPRNILLYGPPGTGKTMLVKAVAKESNCLLFICTASALTSKWHGEGEKLLRELFRVARAATPSIIFVDEMDALLSNRSEGEHEASRRFKTEFMTQVDGVVHRSDTTKKGHLLLIACTNCPWDVDPAVLRRFPCRIYIPLPDSKTRKILLKGLLGASGKHSLSKDEIKTVVKRLSGFSGSDIAGIASDASFGPIRSLGGIEAIRTARENSIRPLSFRDFDEAILRATKSVGNKHIQRFETWEKEQSSK
eukprot:Nitzschia sp. Nitz4//scaffold199_size41809//8189//9772//NITZ4_007445-RA/size41809-processed-gene-0.56-mRNA-1//-1//CDS//3329540546//9332//frame0